MKTIKVKYIAANDTKEKTIELYDVNRVTENLIGEYLAIEIDDSKHTNNTTGLTDMVKGTIVAIIIEDENNNILYEISDYIKLKSFNRTLYNVLYEEDNNANNDNNLRLIFVKTIEEE